MKIFHTADWHLGKIIQGMRMTEDQQYILNQFIKIIEQEQPDAVIIAGDLYDRQVPPTEAVQLLNDTLEKIVLDLKVPVIAVGGNHDSPSRLDFANKMMRERGLHIAGHVSHHSEPVVLQDEFGDVHFHLVPYSDPSTVRHLFENNEIRTHHEAAEAIVKQLTKQMDPAARHVFIGHAFVTPYGEQQDNTSESERPLAMGGAEYVNASLFEPFDYTALGHLHRAHNVMNETIRYSGSILKYSISEENHQKGFYIVELDGVGEVTVEKRDLIPRRDMRTVKGTMEEILTHEVSDDYVFISLEDEATVLSPMEKVRSVYPNAMHVTRENLYINKDSKTQINEQHREEMSDLALFKAFYEEVTGVQPSEESEEIFTNVLDDLLQKDVNVR